MLFYLITALIVLLLILFVQYLKKHYYLLAIAPLVKTTDGTPLGEKVFVAPGKTIFGNNLDVINETPKSTFEYFREKARLSRGKSYLLYFLFAPVYNIINVADVEEVMQSTALITKGVIYNLIKPLMGEGLLISTDNFWHFRRKMLTPAFHFNILQSFLEIFNEETAKLITKLNAHTDEVVKLLDFIPQCTLNSICETALGIKLDQISGSEEYRQAINQIELIVVTRTCNPLMYYDWIFKYFGNYKELEANLGIVHGFSSRVIQKKREEYKMARKMGQEDKIDEFGKKKRHAMLDTLLNAESEGLIDNQGICDEVDTFMFEGYDTTATCLMFTLMSLALNPDVQEKCYREIIELGELSKCNLYDYNRLNYLECVVKESLRLYPSVPLISRMVIEKTQVNGLILPANTQIMIHIWDIMRDGRYFEDPLSFKPERFLAENSEKRHPFAFVAFSAGQRNCIGQKFAMLEIKVILSSILRNFKLLPVTRLEDIDFLSGMVLHASKKIQVKFQKR